MGIESPTKDQLLKQAQNRPDLHDQAVKRELVESAQENLETKKIVSEGFNVFVYRAMFADELEEVNLDKGWILPHGDPKDPKIWIGMSPEDSETYSPPYLCEVVLIPGEEFNSMYDHFMGTHIGWIRHSIPSFRIRVVTEETQVGARKIRNKAKELGLNVLDIFYFLKQKKTLPESVEQVSSFFLNEVERLRHVESEMPLTYSREDLTALKQTTFLKMIMLDSKLE